MLGADAALMVDANQGWSLEQAQRQARAFEPHRLGWIEEPLRADRPAAEWAALAASTSTPLAAGENLLGLDAFDEAVAARRYAVVQPDIAKWGGISGCWPVIEQGARGRAALLPALPRRRHRPRGIGSPARRGRRRRAARGRCQPEPAAQRALPGLEAVADGFAALGSAPGIGIEVDPARLRALCR